MTLPVFNFDAQVTVCSRNGQVIRHRRISSLGHSVDTHEGTVLWSSFPYESGDRPFQILLRQDQRKGWVVWADKGYSQLYAPITGRHNHRVCIAHSHWHKKTVYFLEIHQELTDELDGNALEQLGHLIGTRINKVEEELPKGVEQ